VNHLPRSLEQSIALCATYQCTNFIPSPARVLIARRKRETVPQILRGVLSCPNVSPTTRSQSPQGPPLPTSLPRFKPNLMMRKYFGPPLRSPALPQRMKTRPGSSWRFGPSQRSVDGTLEVMEEASTIPSRPDHPWTSNRISLFTTRIRYCDPPSATRSGLWR
jgi:hypothetical protein